MKKAVMYGAGNIGRGFIGPKLRECGYDLCFIDVDESLVNEINGRGRYPQTIVSEIPKEIWVEGVQAINGRNEDEVIRCIAQGDLLATSLGANVLPRVAPLIAKALHERWKLDPESTLDILICENLNHADKILHDLLYEALSEEDKEKLDRQIGLVETSIGRMVPVMTEEMQQGDRLRVCVEEYDFLPIDKDAFKGNLLEGPRIVPFSPFSFYLQRKLFLHNMGHALTAYLGEMLDYEYIYQAIANPYIRFFVQSAMTQSALVLHKAYNMPIEDLLAHIDDLLYRFSNKALGDTVARVGRDPLRKIAKGDRFAGAMEFCEANGVYPIYLTLGMAAALFSLEKGGGVQETAGQMLQEKAGIQENTVLGKDILSLLAMLEQGADFAAIQAWIEQRKHEMQEPIA